ncbi:hypothetical protein MRY87_13050 [bacterium]|nr:hypothetical protein [bacterium]
MKSPTLRTAALFLLILTCAIALALISGCKGGNEGNTASSQGDGLLARVKDVVSPPTDFLDLPLAEKLPPTTYGFFAWDAERPSAKQYIRFAESLAVGTTPGEPFSLRAWADKLLSSVEASDPAPSHPVPSQTVPEGSLDQTNSHPAATSPKTTRSPATRRDPIVRPLLQLVVWLSENELVPFVPNQKSILTQGVAFVELKDDLPLPGFGAYLRAKDASTLQKRLESFQQYLKEKGHTVQPVPGKYATAFRLVPESSTEKSRVAGQTTPSQNDPAQAAPFALHFASSGDILSIATTEPLLARAFEEVNEGAVTGASRIRKSDTYQKLRKDFTGEEEFALAYLDVDRLLQRFGQMAPPEVVQELPFSLQEFPAESAAWRFSFTDTARTDINLLVRESAVAKGQPLHPTTQKRKMAAHFGHAPSDSVFYLGINGSVFDAIRGSVAKFAVRDPNSPNIGEAMDLLSRFSSLAIGVLPSDGSTVFPGIFAEMEANPAPDGESPLQLIKGALTTAAQKQGIPATAWQQKQVEELPVEYLLTPLGLGVFLSSRDSKFYLTTSESSLRQLLLTENGKAKSLKDSLKGSSRDESFHGNSQLFTAYFNGERTVSLLQSIESSLALFTGGKPLIPAEQLQQIRSAGISYTAATYHNQVMTFSGLTYAPEKKVP